MLADLILDVETRSCLPLKKVGAHRYSLDNSTQCFIACYGQHSKDIKRWRPLVEPPPYDLVTHIADGGKVVAHNAQFERVIWNNTIRRDYPFLPPMTIEQMSCTMVRAFSCNLPGKLEQLLKVLGLPEKDMSGHAVMQRITRPRKVAADGTVTWWEDEDRIGVVEDYCEQDVYSEGFIHATLPELSEEELALWRLDQYINERGVPIDMAFVNRAAELVEYAKRRAHDEIWKLTGGEVSKTTDVQGLTRWLNKRGVTTGSLRAGDRARLIAMAEFLGDDEAEGVIETRMTGAKTSTAKYKAQQLTVCADGYERGSLQFGGAQQTMRWAGRLTQKQNYPRVADDNEEQIVAFVVGLTKDTTRPLSQIYDMIEAIGPPNLANGDRQDGLATLTWLSRSLRSTIGVVDPRDTLIGGDFSNIEGRVNAWLSDEHWKLQAFRAYDTGTGPDLYNLAFARSFNVPVESVTKPQRQIGKVEELACGYQGGVGAFVTMVNTYLIKLVGLAKAIQQTTPADQWDAMAARYQRATDKFDLDEFVWTAVKLAVVGWRKVNPQIVSNWWELQDAAITATLYPSSVVPVYGGRCKYVSDGNFLYCVVPSGGALMYCQPHVVEETKEVIYDGAQYITTDTLLPEELDALVSQGYKVTQRKSRGVRFYGLSDTKQWVRKALYGGYQCENIVQRVARDVMAAAMRRADAAGFSLRLTVHDELLALTRLNWYERPADRERQFKCLMEQPLTWAPGLPVVAKTWSGPTYTK